MSGRPAARLLAVALGAVLVIGALSALAPVPPTLTPITAGNLVWNFDRSFRQLAGYGETSDGASIDPSGNLVWPVTGGGYDPVARTTVVTFAGRVHWRAQPDPANGRPRIDLTLANPQVRLDAVGSLLSAEVIQLDGGGVQSLGRVPLAALTLDGLLPALANGTTAWRRIPAALTRPAAEKLLDGRYPAGQPLDPVEFAYPGPGGAPDLSEGFGPPGRARLERSASTAFPWTGAGGGWRDPLFVDERTGVVYTQVIVAGSGPRIQSFDTRSGRYGAPQPPLPVERFEFADASTGRVYYRSTPNGPLDSYLERDGDRWRTVVMPTPLVVRGRIQRQLWDAERRRFYTFDREVPPGIGENDFPSHAWHLNTYTETAPGVFAETTALLAPGPPARNRDWYGDLAAVASDGSILLRPNAALHSALARRIVPGTEPVVADVPGTESPAPPSIVVGKTGNAALIAPGNPSGPAQVQMLRIDPAGVAVLGPPAEFAQADAAGAYDPDGTLWLQTAQDRRLLVLREGRVVADQVDPLPSERATFVWVGPDHVAHVLSDVPAPEDGPVGYRFGFAAFTASPVYPAVLQSVTPSEPRVVISRPNERVPLLLTAAGQPGATVRWQSRPSGEPRFADLPGAVNSTLALAVAVQDNRTQYRAVFGNGAGSVATEPVTLVLAFAPRFTFQPVPIVVAPGEGARFAAQALGSPEPIVTWQRELDGRWVDLAGGPPVVGDITPDLAGARYRARAVNPVGTAFSDVVTLTVAAPTAPPTAAEALLSTAEVGEFAWAIDSANLVRLDARDTGEGYLQAVGSINPIVVTDNRPDAPSWSLSAQASAFTGGLSAGYLGWTPQILRPGAGAVAGPFVPPGFPSGPGLSVGSLLAFSPGGHQPGTGRIAADVVLRLPDSTRGGTYSSVLTITAVS